MTVEKAPLQATDQRQIALLAKDADEAVVAVVQQALTDQGALLEQGGWLVDVALAVRPVTVGGFSDEEARSGEWTEAPRRIGARRGKNLHTLTVVMSQIDSLERRTAQVSARHDAETTPEPLLLELADAAAGAVLQGHQKD